MSRGHERIDYGYTVEERAFSPNFVLEPYGQRYRRVGIEYLSRSDVTRTEPDALKWRRPTPYSTDLLLEVEWNGDKLSSRYYFGSHENDIRLSGCLIDVLPSMRAYPRGFDSHDTSLTARAEVNALLKARDQKANFSVAIAESQKAVTMINNRLSQVYRAAVNLKKGNLTGAAATLGIGKHKFRKGKQQSDSWLELQYGWIPLLLDVHGAYEELTRQARENGYLFKVHSTIRKPLNVTMPFDGSEGYQGALRFKGQQLSKCVLWYTVTFEGLQTAARVGLTNPMEIVWELSPFSFLADWVVPIGDVLGALTATQGLTFKGGTLTELTRFSTEGNATFNNVTLNPFVKLEQSGSASCSGTYVKHRRAVYNASPIPVPYIKNPISVGHGLNAIALLRSIF